MPKSMAPPAATVLKIPPNSSRYFGLEQGALIFFGKGRCVSCHAVKGQANEMFSDFENHDIGVPQIAPAFGPTR